MRKVLLMLFLVNSIYSIGQLPNNFPDKWRNKIICGSASANGKMLDGSSTWMDIPFKLTISDNGIFAEYNGGEKSGENDWGTTQTISTFEVASTEPLYWDNKIYGYKTKYKVPNAYRNSAGIVDTKHTITEIWLETYVEPNKSSVLGVKILYGPYSTTISSNHVVYKICE
jgi:hypothetical protein